MFLLRVGEIIVAFANFRGVYIKGCKDALKNAEIVELKNSTNFCVPLKLGAGEESKLLVEVGSSVKAGSVLASPSDNTSGFIYSPVSGSVVSIKEGLNALGFSCKIVEIEPSVKDIQLFFKPIAEHSNSNLFGRLIESGSFDNWGQRLPSYCKYINKNIKDVKTLIVKLYDSDGFIYSNTTIAKKYYKEVALGASLFYKISGALEIIFTGVDEFDNISAKIKEQMNASGIALGNIKFIKSHRNYPSDYDNLLVKILTDKTIKIGNPVCENGVVIENAQTCLNFYNAVYENKPTTSVLYTISGTNFKKPVLAFIKNGTTAKELFLGFSDKKLEEIKTFALGSVMCGVSQCDFNVGLPVSLSSLNSFVENNDRQFEIDCINCGKCNKVCPTRLAPVLLDNFALEKDFGRADRYGVHACIGCGACSFVCPAKRFLSQRIYDMKTAISEGRTM